MNNYHWYLKQSLSHANRRLVRPRWDPEDPALYSLVSGPIHPSGDGGENLLETVRLSWAVSASRGQTEADMAVVAVIDGHRLKVTPFRQAVVPPPMSAYEIRLGGQVEAVLFPGVEAAAAAAITTGLLHSAAGDPNSMAVVTQNRRLFVFSTVPDSEITADGDRFVVAEEEKGVGVDITGTGGTGYTAQTARHRLMGSLELGVELEKGWSRLTNWAWIGARLLVSHASTIIVLRVSLSC